MAFQFCSVERLGENNRMRKTTKKALLVVLFLASMLSVFNVAPGLATNTQTIITITFEEFYPGGPVCDPDFLIGSYYEELGVIFTSDWYAYSEDPDYPAHSGSVTAVGIIDFGTVAIIDFTMPVTDVGAYFNVYSGGYTDNTLTFSAYNGKTLLGSVIIQPTPQPTPGGPVYYSLPYDGITRVTITRSPEYPSSFYNLDDLTFTIPTIISPEQVIQDLKNTVEDLEEDCFVKPEEDVADIKDDFLDKFDDIAENIEEGNYERAIEHLEEAKAFAYEQITESAEREGIIAMIDVLIEYLETL